VSEANPPETPRVSRRKAIGIGGAAAAAAWAAPSILAIDKVGAAGTVNAPTFKGTAQGWVGPGNGDILVTLPIPNPFVIGDRLIAVGVLRWSTGGQRDGTMSPPVGTWDQVGSWTQPLETPSVGIRGYLWTKPYDGASSYTFERTNNGNQTEGSVVIAGFGGVNSTTPFDGTSSAVGESTGVSVGGFTTTVDNDTLLFIGGGFGDATMSWTTPADYTAIAEGPTATAPEIFIASRVQTVAAPTGTQASTIAGFVPGQDDWVAYQVALRPAP
jgi:hypothetical protein